MTPFDVLKSEIIYPGKAFTIRRDHLRMPDGHEARFDIVEHGGSVIILPVDDQGNLLFVRQYRHAAGLELVELPAGVLDGKEDPGDCALRELREETGMAAAKLTPLGGFYLAPGYSTEYMHVFLATGLFPSPLEADPDEYLSLERIPLARAIGMAACGEIPDAKSLAAFCMAAPHLERLK